MRTLLDEGQGRCTTRIPERPRWGAWGYGAVRNRDVGRDTGTYSRVPRAPVRATGASDGPTRHFREALNSARMRACSGPERRGPKWVTTSAAARQARAPA